MNIVRCIPLTDESGYTRASLVELVSNDLLVGPQLGLIQSGKKRTGVHVHPVLDVDFREYAASRMLYFLHMRFDDEFAWQHHRAGNRYYCAPNSRNNDADNEDPQSGF